MASYDLGKNINLHEVVNNPEYAKQKHIKVKRQDGLCILKYDKQQLRLDNIDTLGLFRSVIMDGDKIICFSPPKSSKCEEFMEKFSPIECSQEYFVEGTMINCFYHNDKWKVATRWDVGAKGHFYADGNKSFSDMFQEALVGVNLQLNDLNKELCYSFVLQHPENRIVVPFIVPYIILVAVYKCDDNHVHDKTSAMEQEVLKLGIPTPKKFNYMDWKTIKDIFASQTTDYKVLGLMFHHVSGLRGKIRNPVYEKVRRLKGNQSKIQYQYYCLYQKNQIQEFLKYYPEHKDKFWEFRSELVAWTTRIVELYRNYNIYKTIAADDIPFQFRTHIWELHQIYLLQLKNRGLSITKKDVIHYIYNLNPARLMYSINYPLRHAAIEEQIGIHYPKTAEL